MTSTSIYTAINPTYLYIKQHCITGLKYFGKTTRNPYKYNGSGKRWTRHINKHGKEHIVTLWVSKPYTDTSITEFALKFSIDNDIVNSKEWANLIPENGLDGGSPKGRKIKPFSDKHKANLSAARKGKLLTRKHKANISAAGIGRVLSEKTKLKISNSHKGKIQSTHTDATKLKMSLSSKGKVQTKQHNEAISAGLKGKQQKQVTCPHCGKTGGATNMKRYHFDNCKLK